MADILNHVLVPKHEIVSEAEKRSLLESLKVTEDKLPKILSSDPATKSIGAKLGDVIKITRNSPTANEALYYRIVVEG
jgi:DNA-directed RNA polymerase subunit H